MKNKSALLLTIGLGLSLVAGWLLAFSGFGIPEGVGRQLHRLCYRM